MEIFLGEVFLYVIRQSYFNMECVLSVRYLDLSV